MLSTLKKKHMDQEVTWIKTMIKITKNIPFRTPVFLTLKFILNGNLPTPKSQPCITITLSSLSVHLLSPATAVALHDRQTCRQQGPPSASPPVVDLPFTRLSDNLILLPAPSVTTFLPLWIMTRVIHCRKTSLGQIASILKYPENLLLCHPPCSQETGIFDLTSALHRMSCDERVKQDIFLWFLAFCLFNDAWLLHESEKHIEKLLEQVQVLSYLLQIVFRKNWEKTIIHHESHHKHFFI